MAPRRKAKGAEPAALSLSPRRTRSGAVGKRVAPPPDAPVKSKKKIRFAGEKKKEKEKEKNASEVEEEEEAGKAAPATGEAKSIIIEAWYLSLISLLLYVYMSVWF